VPLGTRRQGPGGGARALRSDLDSARPSTYTFPETVRAEELLLRPPTAADVDIVAPAFRDPDVGGEAGLPPVDADTLRVLLREQLPLFRARGLMAPYLIEDTTTGTILGGANLRLFDPMRDTVELGYWLFVEARGRGVATRVVRALVEHAQANGLVRVEAHVRIGNLPSERVLERVGFEREGIKRRLLRHGGERVDATLFALVTPDAV
jgi:RimJ/RimL family protein N-acetyltransferase